MSEQQYINSRALRWCFTLNNYTADEEQKIRLVDCRYLVFGHEVGQNGTYHLQGFVCFDNRKAFSTVKSLLGQRCHIEVARGTVQQNYDYCTKQDEDGYYEKGTKPEEQSTAGGQATKRKWDEARELARSGHFEQIPSDLWIRYRKAFKEEYQEWVNKNPKPIDDICLKDHFYWIWGPTGTGKSTTARNIAASIDSQNPPYLKALNKWWSGYRAEQKVVIIEEANPDVCKMLSSYFKLWLDKWPFPAETKGGQFENGIRPEYIIVTSNYSIDECFSETDVEPLKRRCTEFHKERLEQWIPIRVPERSHSTQLLEQSNFSSPNELYFDMQNVHIDRQDAQANLSG